MEVQSEVKYHTGLNLSNLPTIVLDMQDPKLDYWWQRMRDGKAVWQQLLTACRKADIEVMYTIMESLTQDGRDRSLDYKISGTALFFDRQGGLSTCNMIPENSVAHAPINC